MPPMASECQPHVLLCGEHHSLTGHDSFTLAVSFQLKGAGSFRFSTVWESGNQMNQPSGGLACAEILEHAWQASEICTRLPLGTVNLYPLAKMVIFASAQSGPQLPRQVELSLALEETFAGAGMTGSITRRHP